MSLVDITCESLTIPCDLCFSCMFYNCTSLTTPPELPATTLAEFCYGSMFQGCTSLTTAPALPATTLAAACYASMFQGCTSLNVYNSSGSGHTNLWRIPTSGTATENTTQTRVFYGTTGDYASTLSINFATTTNFYTQNTPVS